MEHIDELFLEAREELKRLEHIIYVSLKYTRTVDVIINALKRLVSVYDLIIEALLEFGKKSDLVDNLAKSPALRAKKLAEIYQDDPKFQNYLEFYYFLKTILNSSYQRREEFRRHVTFVVELEKCTAEMDIDNLTNCEKFTHDYLYYAREKVYGKVVEED
jgi:hypothetical protein